MKCGTFKLLDGVLAVVSGWDGISIVWQAIDIENENER
jgi:hypothetical protein